MNYSGCENPVAYQLEYESENEAVTSPSEPDISSSEGEQQQQQQLIQQLIQQQQEQQQIIHAANEEDDRRSNILESDNESESMIRIDSSDEEDNDTVLMHRLNLVLNQYREPRVAVERAIMSEDPQPSTSGNVGQRRAGMLHNFYSTRAPPSERSFHNIEDSYRLVWNSFDETSPLDRRVNECKNLNLNIFLRKRLFLQLFLLSKKVIRRRNNSGDGFLLTYARRILHVRRAQELR